MSMQCSYSHKTMAININCQSLSRSRTSLRERKEKKTIKIRSLDTRTCSFKHVLKCKTGIEYLEITRGEVMI